MNASNLFHLLPLTAHRSRTEAPITAPSLETEGFVHCSPDPETTLAVANSRYRTSEEQMVLLELDPSALSAPVHWEQAAPAPPEGVSSEVLFPHVYGALDRSAVLGVSYARRDATGTYVGFERRGRTAERLDLLPHPEGGWYRRTWVSPAAAEITDERGERPAATAIHFLLPAGEQSAWHSVTSDELWMWHGGAALTLSTAGGGDAPSTDPESVTLGSDLAAGEVPQALIPAGTWQRAEASTSEETLVSCVVSPGFDFADFTTI